jgi:hypothetical protein
MPDRGFGAPDDSEALLRVDAVLHAMMLNQAGSRTFSFTPEFLRASVLRASGFKIQYLEAQPSRYKLEIRVFFTTT